MIRMVLDFETYYAKDYTLSKLTTEEYVRDPRFKVHCLGVKIDRDPAFCLTSPGDLARFLKETDWAKVYAICHHAHFDGAIFSWRAGVRPGIWGCTLSMVRALYPWESSSLANMSRLLGLGEKGHDLVSTLGKRTLTPEEMASLAGYCVNDVELTAAAFDAMKGRFPVSELRLIDATVRKFTEPVLRVNRAPLVQAFIREKRTKRALLKQCATDKTVLASDNQFAALLLTLGIDPPKKLSPSKVKDGRVDPDSAGDPPQGLLPSFKAWRGATAEEKTQLKTDKDTYPWSYAFSKSDEEFKMLLDHPDPQVQAVVEARFGVESTIKETRSKRFYKIGTRGAFPVYLNYYGAHTGRFSGGDKQNAQNLNRVDPKDPVAGALRMSLVAPEGHQVVVRDLSQIEARMLVYWAGQEDMLDMFRAGGDPYDFMASKVYGRQVQRKKVAEDAKAGQVGKIVVLGCGYQMGWGKLQEAIRVGFMGMEGIVFDESYVAQLGVNVEGFKASRSYKKGFAYLGDEALASKPLNVSEEDYLRHCAVTKFLVDSFRQSNPKVVALWREAQSALNYVIVGQEILVGPRPLLTTCAEGLRMPNEMVIRYHKLRRSDGGEYKYLANARKKEWTKIYAGKIVENGVQALSRVVLTDQEAQVRRRIAAYPLRPGEHAKVATTTHDEIVCVVPDRYVEDCYKAMGRIMATPPAWCADLPLKSSGGYARSYGDCEK